MIHRLASWLVRPALILLTGMLTASPALAAVTQLKDMRLNTTLATGGRPAAAIVAPGDGRYDEAVAVIQRAVRAAGGVELPVLADDAGSPEALLADRALIVLGNMATSDLMYTLYSKRYTMLDLRYPGKNGSVVRSLHDPYGTGQNVILIGGSDDAGVLKAAQRFAEMLKPADPLTVGWIMDIKLGDDVPPPPDPQSDDIYAWSDSTRYTPEGKRIGRNPLTYSGWNPFSVQATLYYMTGDEKYLQEFLRLAIPDPNNLPREVERLYVERSETGEYDLTHPIGMAHHYTTHRMPLVWDLIEESPLLTDAQRLRITNDLITNFERVSNYGPGTSRHGSYVALTMHTIARYFDKSYPDAKWTQAMDRARQTFAAWLEHPIWGEGDDLPWISTCIHPVMHYYLLTDPRPWIDSGVARELMDALPAIWSGRPYESAISEQPLNLMLAATWLLGDETYGYMAHQAKYDLDLFRIGRSWWLPGDVQGPPAEAMTERLIVVPLPAPDAEESGVPWDPRLGYHFVSYRAGPGPDDAFFVLDGFDGRQRNPHHIAAIYYLRNGGKELLSGYGNQMAVLRNGLSANKVPMASQLKGAFAGEGMAYVHAYVPDDAFSETRRELLRVDDRLMLVIDTVKAQRSGDFEVTTTWEPVTPVRPSDQDARWAQGEGDRPITLVSSLPVRSANTPGPLQHSSSLASLVADIVTDDYALSQWLERTLRQGDSVTQVHAVYADDAPGRFAYRLEPVADGVTLVTGDRRAVVFTGEADAGPLGVAATTAYVNGQRLLLHQGRQVRLGGDPLVTATQPVDLAWDFESGTLTAESTLPLTLTLRLASDAKPTTEAGDLKLTRDGAAVAIQLPAGRHEITGVAPEFAGALADALNDVQPQPVSSVADTTAPPSPDWSPAWSLDLDGAVRLIKPIRDELWVSSATPALHRVGVDGSERWSLELPTTAEALDVKEVAGVPGGVLAVAGGMDNQLRAFDGEGKLLWEVESQVWPGHNTGRNRWDASWYTDPRRITGIRSILIGDLTGDGPAQVLVGRPATIEGWTLNGKLIHRHFVRWGEVGHLQLLPGEDHTRLLVGSFYTGRSILMPYNPKLRPEPFHKRRWNYMMTVPPDATEMEAGLQRGISAVRVIDLDGDGEREVIVARGGHWNDVRAYNRDGSECLWMHSFGPAAPRIVQELTGVFVRDMSVGATAGERGPTTVVGLANGWAHCFAADGRIAWSQRFPVPVNRVAHVAGRVAVGLTDGTVVLIDRRGAVLKTARLDGEISALAAAGEDGPRQRLLAGTDVGTLVALEP